MRAAQRITGGDHRGKDDGKERGSDAGSNADTDENAPTREPMPIMVAPKTPTSASMFRLSSQSEVQDIWLRGLGERMTRRSAKGQSATSAGHASMSERSPEADIELNYVNVAES